jgi:hypothetical protein
MPQASEAVPFVRHAIIAVAALSKITGDAEHTLMRRGEGEEASRLRIEYQYALQQYEKTLKGMRRAIELGEHVGAGGEILSYFYLFMIFSRDKCPRTSETFSIKQFLTPPISRTCETL